METLWSACYQSEKIKSRHTFSRHLCWIMPACSVLMAFILSWNYIVTNGYNWWYTTLLPGMLSLVCAYTGQRDKKLKNQTVLTLPVDRKKIWDAKMLLCLKTLVLSNLVLAVSASGAGVLVSRVLSLLTPVGSISALQAAGAVVMLSITFLWQIPFCLFLEQRLGFFPAFFINVVLNIAGSIAMSLEQWWFLNPYAIPARVMCAVLRILPNGLLAVEGSVTFSPELLHKSSICIGAGVSLFWFAVLWAVTRRWYEKKGAQVS